MLGLDLPEVYGLRFRLRRAASIMTDYGTPRRARGQAAEGVRAPVGKTSDCAYGPLTVRAGKGMEDRGTLLPERLQGPLHLHEPLRLHLAKVQGAGTKKISPGALVACVYLLPWSARALVPPGSGLGSTCFFPAAAR